MLALPYNPFRKQLLVMAIATWVFLGLFLLFVHPNFVRDVVFPSSYFLFFLVVFLGLMWLTWGISGRWKRSLLWSLIMTVALWLRVNSLLSIINLVLLIGFGVVWGYYWRLSRNS